MNDFINENVKNKLKKPSENLKPKMLIVLLLFQLAFALSLIVIVEW